MQIADPLTQPDDKEIIERLEDEAREQRWADFESFVWAAKVPILLRHIADLMEGRRDPYYWTTEVQQRILAFQETEGWGGTLAAIARTLHQAK